MNVIQKRRKALERPAPTKHHLEEVPVHLVTIVRKRVDIDGDGEVTETATAEANIQADADAVLRLLQQRDMGDDRVQGARVFELEVDADGQPSIVAEVGAR